MVFLAFQSSSYDDSGGLNYPSRNQLATPPHDKSTSPDMHHTFVEVLVST